MRVKKFKVPSLYVTVFWVLLSVWCLSAIIGHGFATGATIGGGVVILHYEGEG